MEDGRFNRKYPEERVELVVGCGEVIFDEGVFEWRGEESMEGGVGFIDMVEC